MVTALDKQAALLLIDLQKGILKTPKAHPVEQILDKASELMRVFREKGQTIVIVHVEPSGPWLKSRKEAAGPGGDLPEDFTKIADELHTEAGNLFISKPGWNAFYNTALHEQLQKRGITQLVIGGVSTSIGVEGTARAASELGYNICFATDAMTDSHADAHENSITRIFPRMGETGKVSEIIPKIQSRQ